MLCRFDFLGKCRLYFVVVSRLFSFEGDYVAYRLFFVYFVFFTLSFLFVWSRRVVVEFSAFYFFCCFLGGVISGLAHTSMTPVDLVKCGVQVGLYNSMTDGFRSLWRNCGGCWFRSISVFTRGWVPTFFGYSSQGGLKFLLYELLKFWFCSRLEGSAASPMVLSYVSKLGIFVVSSGVAEIFADVALAPWEAVKIIIQTSNVAHTELSYFFPLVYSSEGIYGFYKGLPALWCRQVPYTVVKFLSFEVIVRLAYRYLLTSPSDPAPKYVQLLVSVISGVLAGFLCAAVSHPADTVVSKLNQRVEGSPAADKRKVVQIVRELGWSGLWKGVELRMMMTGALTALQWLLYDSFKVSVGLSATGGNGVRISNHVDSDGRPPGDNK
ncbi:mitochondrial carrier protein [Trypanosoma brucei equiperdum]|uniref:Mitochondrial carrier protein n=1 Tax=Trypanosoma brucei equiperdum TaxID=630700 RepID=A0A3L6KZD9_9TRYP|nr:mitochondrial carrier protein [Trypanosoma brucei equiperdum]